MKSFGLRLMLAVILMGAVGVGWLIFSGVQDWMRPAEQLERSLSTPVEVAPIQRGAIELRRTFSGALEATAEFVVAPKVSGRVERVNVDLADTVKRGQVVAELDDDEYVQAVAQAKADLAVAKANLDTLASIYELRGFTEALLADTEIAYWNYVLARKEIAIFEQSLDIAKQQRDEIEQRIEVGVLAEMEIPAARAEVARREQALIDARSLLEERPMRLLRLTNPDPASLLDRKVNATSEPAIKPQPITDLTERLQLAVQMRPDLNEARLRLNQNRLETIVTRNGLLPRLDLFIALGKTGFADTFSDSFRELNGETYDFSAGVRLSTFLGNRAAKARHVAARASQRQAAEAVDNLRQLVGLDVRLAVNEVERARQQIEASRVTRTFAEQTLKAEMERFDVGLSTALLVAQAQRDLLLSQIGEVRAIINYRTALVGLYLAEGSLLERRGVRLASGKLAEHPELSTPYTSNPLPGFSSHSCGDAGMAGDAMAGQNPIGKTSRSFCKWAFSTWHHASAYLPALADVSFHSARSLHPDPQPALGCPGGSASFPAVKCRSAGFSAAGAQGVSGHLA